MSPGLLPPSLPSPTFPAPSPVRGRGHSSSWEDQSSGPGRRSPQCVGPQSTCRPEGCFRPGRGLYLGQECGYHTTCPLFLALKAGCDSQGGAELWERGQRWGSAEKLCVNDFQGKTHLLPRWSVMLRNIRISVPKERIFCEFSYCFRILLRLLSERSPGAVAP